MLNFGAAKPRVTGGPGPRAPQIRTWWQLPIDIFPFCREWLLTKEPVALWIALLVII